MALDNSWFSEIYSPEGAAFSLKVKKKLHEEKTPYQRIEIYETQTFGKLMVIDGCIMLSDRDNFIYHEMISHPTLYTHPRPSNVLIIGGGDCGTLREVLKHPSVQEVHQVEIDLRVTQLSEKYFPDLCSANNDARAHFHFSDGIQWIQNAEAESIDIIIVDSTDPVGPAAGLFTQAFYEACWKALRPKGLLMQQSESPLFHTRLIRDIHHAMRNAGYRSTRSLYFPQCVYPSGWWSATLAGKGIDPHHFREQDAKNKPFITRYYTAAVHQAAFAAPAFLENALNVFK